MARLFEHYYLQRNAGHVWDTVAQSDSVVVLRENLADQLAASGMAEIRIVGAVFDEQSERWSYEQLFYIDQSSIDLGISEQDDGGEDPGQTEDPRPEDIPVPEPGPAIAALREERETLERAEPVTEVAAPDADPEPSSVAAAPSDDPEPIPWSNLGGGDDQSNDDDEKDDDIEPDSEEIPPWRGMGDDTPEDQEPAPWLTSVDPEDEPEPFQFGTPKRRRFPVGKVLLTLLIAVFLLVVAGLGSMVYFQHPMLLMQADNLGIGNYIRFDSPEIGAMNSPAMPGTPAVEPVEPLTTGQVIRFAGVAPSLLGRWSPRKCDTTFIEFTEEGYHRTVNGQSSAEMADVTETLKDEFQFYLRRSPTVVEHYRRITPNDIQLAGVTTESGFLQSSIKAEIYSRCK